MASPFPGMDPYIEDPEVWSDFHGRLPEAISAQLNGVLQPRYLARLVPRVASEPGVDAPLRLFTVEVFEAGNRRVVTAIEILSPTDKQADARSHDRRGQHRTLHSWAHWMEIDLLRGGERPPLETPVPPAPYYVTLSGENRRPRVEVWPIQLQDPLPTLPVPLLEPDPDLPLDLGGAVAAVYERGAYAVLIDYHQPPPPPPLSDAEAAWLDEHLRARGAR